MELTIHKRPVKKSEVNKARRNGLIPAVIYKKGHPGEAVAVESAAFKAFLRQLTPGYLPTTQITLVDEHGKKRRVLVKDIQYKITNYEVIHLDFLELVNDMPINAKVPIECVGAADSVGIKLGGVLRQVIRYVRVRCLPKDLPEALILDVRDMGARDKKRLRDIPMPEALRPLDSLNEVAVVIAKR